MISPPMTHKIMPARRFAKRFSRHLAQPCLNKRITDAMYYQVTLPASRLLGELSACLWKYEKSKLKGISFLKGESKSHQQTNHRFEVM